ncbi:RrF2 family transcriptional regulator [Hyphomonas sp.]|uniref:RrF2 family transcriptional regulator n=1 Tax=Hyphomonas sp. TaxID=87 RepID=UPI00391A8A69
MISQKSKYALRALLALAEAPGDAPLLIGDIAAQEVIPRKFLEQILLELKHHGLVVSRRGKAGGYLLLRRPETVTFGEVLRLMDGPLAPLPCLSKMAYRRCGDCASEQACKLRKVFAQVAEATRAILDTTTLADALADPALRSHADGRA